jgi:hypothetical protein
MQKTIYVSTAEGRYMVYVLKVVDGCFRKLYRSLSEGKLEGEKYKTLLLGWEKFLEKHMEYLVDLSQRYTTDYIEKTRQKKMEICLKDLRVGGEKNVVSLNSYLGKKLFDAATSTEMCFRLISEYAMSGDVSLDALLALTESFSRRRNALDRSLSELVKLEKRVAKLRPKAQVVTLPTTQKKIARGA